LRIEKRLALLLFNSNKAMNKPFLTILFTAVFLVLTSLSDVKTAILSEGRQPQIGVDGKGVVRVIFGLQDEIFCTTSNDQGTTFGKPVLVAKVAGMHLGMSRGPQIASSDKYSVITAMDKAGNIHWFRLNNSSGEWKNMGVVNDLKGSAPEGLMGLTADKKDNFYAVWLDTRTGEHNQVYFSSLSGRALNWSANILAYRSPEGHVCECCKPNIAVQGATVAIMFRNWLDGSRDLYLLKSPDRGKSFATAQKLGTDTWKLNGCPMDGGGIVVGQSGIIRTTWQRKGVVYYAEPGKPENYIAKGRECNVTETDDNKAVLTYQVNDTVKLIRAENKSPLVIGEGGFLKSVVLKDHKILCVWEQDNKIKYKKI